MTYSRMLAFLFLLGMIPQSGYGLDSKNTIYTPNVYFEPAIRGQNQTFAPDNNGGFGDPFFQNPGSGSSNGGINPGQPVPNGNPILTNPQPAPVFVQPGTQPGVPVYDPFNTQVPPPAFGLDQPFQPLPAYGGLNGPQPFRYGWTSRWDFGYQFGTGAELDDGTSLGNFSVFEANYQGEYITQGPRGWVWSLIPEVNYRAYEGPRARSAVVTDPHLPGSVYRFATGVRLNSPQSGPWSWQLGFTPQIATDLQQNLNSDAYMFDGHIAAFYRADPRWQYVIGAFYWDRVDQIVLPFAGVVWTPNDIWEFRLVFPRPRIEVFLGNFGGESKWLYVGGEYRVEAYQVEIDPPGGGNNTDEFMQIQDWRAVVGIRGENGWLSSFFEVGAVLDRTVEFEHGTSDFDTSPALMLRGGFRY